MLSEMIRILWYGTTVFSAIYRWANAFTLIIILPLKRKNICTLIITTVVLFFNSLKHTSEFFVLKKQFKHSGEAISQRILPCRSNIGIWLIKILDSCMKLCQEKNIYSSKQSASFRGENEKSPLAHCMLLGRHFWWMKWSKGVHRHFDSHDTVLSYN